MGKSDFGQIEAERSASFFGNPFLGVLTASMISRVTGIAFGKTLMGLAGLLVRHVSVPLGVYS